MGERKLRFDTRKNYEGKKRANWVVVNPELKISLPLSLYLSNVFSDSTSLRIKEPKYPPKLPGKHGWSV